MPQPVIEFDRVWKRFRLGEGYDSLAEVLAGGVRRLLHGKPKRRSDDSFWALSDINMTVSAGEAVGIIGPNGAGKSTILKLIAGILRADQGRVAVRGRLAALIEVGAGFHGDLSGRENVFLNGAILGMSHREIRRKLDAIVQFAGIERFIDMPVKRYSSGMYARLGFSIAAHVDPDVLLVDEVLSVGDAVFRLRCEERMRGLVEQGTTLVFVTHNLDQMQSTCSRAIVVQGGRGAFDGPPREAVGQYMKAMSHAFTSRTTDIDTERDEDASELELLDLVFLDDRNEEVVWITSREPVSARVTLRAARPTKQLAIELNMRGPASENMLSLNSARSGQHLDLKKGTHTITLSLPAIPVSGGQYAWNVRVWDVASGHGLLDTPFRFPLAVDDGGVKTGVLSIEHTWSFGGDAASAAARVVAVSAAAVSDINAAERQTVTTVAAP